MFPLNLLWMAGIALVLAVAAFGYRQGNLKGKGVFGLGVVTAVGLLVMATVSCSALPDSARSEQQNATEASPSTKSASSRGSDNIRAMLKEYEANSLRAEKQYRGRTVVVGGKIRSISGGIGAPLLARLENDVVLDFDKKESSSWLLAQNVGDDIEAQCRVTGFHWKGHPYLSDCGQVPE